MQEQRHLTASEPNHNPIGAPSSVPGSSSPGFGDSSGNPSEINSDKTTKDNYLVTIINPASVPSETLTKYPSHVSKELKSTKPSNMLMEYPSGYPTGATITMSTEKPSSNTRYHLI